MHNSFDAFLELIKSGCELYSPGEDKESIRLDINHNTSTSKMFTYISDDIVDIYGCITPSTIKGDNNIFEIGIYESTVHFSENNIFTSKNMLGFEVTNPNSSFQIIDYPDSTISDLSLDISEGEIFQLSTVTDVSLLPLMIRVHDYICSTGKELACTVYIFQQEKLTDEYISDMMEFSKKMKVEADDHKRKSFGFPT